MEREIHKELGVSKRHTYDELVHYIETDPTKIRFPDRTAYFRRNHPFMTQNDGAKAALGEQQRVIDYRMGNNAAPYQKNRPHVNIPDLPDFRYDTSEEVQDMFTRSYQTPVSYPSPPDNDQIALSGEGFDPPPPPQQPSMMSQLTSRVGENASQGVLNAVSQYSQDTAAAAMGWMGRTAVDFGRDRLDFYVNELPAAIRQFNVNPELPPDRFLAPRIENPMWELPAPQQIPAIRDIGVAEEAGVGAGLFEGAEMGAIAGVEMGPLGILAGGLGGAAIAGGGLMLGGSMFHNADHGRSANTVAAEHLAHQAGMENQPFQDFNSLNGLNHAIPHDRGGRGRSVRISTPVMTRHPSIQPNLTADEMLDEALAAHAKDKSRKQVLESEQKARRTPVPSTYGALRDQVGTSSSSSSGGPSRTRTQSHRGPG
jgi:hypothetical protein